jgi:hypothetical protein
LLLEQKSTPEVGVPNYSSRVTDTIRLSFPHLEQSLRPEAGAVALDLLHEGLESDRKLLTEVLTQFAGAESIDHRLLMIDYKLMQKWYSLTRRLDDSTRARKALTEMSLILNYLASEIGENAAG